MLNRGTFEAMIRAMGLAQRLSDAVMVFESLLRPTRPFLLRGKSVSAGGFAWVQLLL
jgi:pentatricopeptide repeat protein